ncbi:hypothetical protein OG984_06435 [Nocardioides sp. NBC_00368]|uniref:hypothetical protein n=1 Tax=Nocardioides sp. NBC_00368 TaxID=2976000 RepID=UPI002E24E401
MAERSWSATTQIFRKSLGDRAEIVEADLASLELIAEMLDNPETFSTGLVTAFGTTLRNARKVAEAVPAEEVDPLEALLNG